MALSVVANVWKPCGTDTLKVQETTGIYVADEDSPYYRPNGWQDASTEFLADATAATIRIYVPDPITLLASSSSTTTNLFTHGFPNIDLSTYEIDQSAVDGIMYYTYSVTISGNPTPYTYSAYKLISCNVDCCVDKMASKATCDKEFMKKYAEAAAIQDTMKKAASCGDLNSAVIQLKKLKRLCASCGCGCQ